MKLKQANPQGKGLSTLSGFLQSLHHQAVIPAKDIQQLSDELFTSLFILHSQFKFKPVINKKYWLYQSNNKFRLSLITPEEWKHNTFGTPIGRCELHTDLTWTLELSDEARNDKNLMGLLDKKKREFDNTIQATEKVINILPGYQKQLPFYQRALAGALSHSLKVSMYKSGIATLSHQAAIKQIHHQAAKVHVYTSHF